MEAKDAAFLFLAVVCGLDLEYLKAVPVLPMTQRCSSEAVIFARNL